MNPFPYDEKNTLMNLRVLNNDVVEVEATHPFFFHHPFGLPGAGSTACGNVTNAKEGVVSQGLVSHLHTTVVVSIRQIVDGVCQPQLFLVGSFF